MKQAFEKIFALLFLAAGILYPPAAGAQVSLPQSPYGFSGAATTTLSGVPKPTDAGHVAMIFNKLNGKAAPFEGWAKMSDDFKNATDFDRAAVLEQKVREMKNLYRLSTVTEPIIVETTAHLSDYSFTNKGFMIDNFTAEKFFPYKFSGEDFAIVIPGLMDYQWLDAADAAALKIDTLAARNGREVKIMIYLEPKSADSTAIRLEGRNYWLISGQLLNIALYDPDDGSLLWEKTTKQEELDQIDPEIRKLNALKN